MSSKLEMELYRAAAMTFEELCFMFPARGNESRDDGVRVEAAVSVEFRGSLSGKLMAKACGGLLPAIAANMLGEEEAPLEQQLDALGEVANIICGNALHGIAGPKEVFSISPPRSVPFDELSNDPRDSPVAEVRLMLDRGRADLLLFFNGEEVL